MSGTGRTAIGVVLGTLYALSGAVTPEPAWAAAPEPAATLPAAGGAAGAAAGDVREAQGLLADLGLWDGAADGIADADFVRAVEGFQRQSGRTATGRLDAETLAALRTRAEAIRTSRQLDAARAAETAEAQAAIAADPQLAARLAPQPGDLTAAAGRDLGPCRAAPTAACLLTEAAESAKGIVDPELRDWVLGEIAVGLAAAAGIDAVWPVLRLTVDPRAAFTGLRRVATARAAAGDAEAALALAAAARALPREALRSHAEVAEALSRLTPPPVDAVRRAEAAAEALLPQVADAGDRRAALATLARAARARGDGDTAAERLNRADALDLGAGQAALVAAAWAEAGHPERAEALLAALPDAAERTPVLVELAAAHARAGAAAAALEAARAVPEPRYRAVALADVGVALKQPEVISDAEAVAAEVELPYATAFAWSRIAEAWRALGRTEDAAAAARRIGDDALRVEALYRLAAAADTPGPTASALAAEAETLRGGMLDRVARVRLAAQRAEQLAAAGSAEAGPAVRATVDDALSVRNPWNRARALVAAARAAAAADRHDVTVPPSNR